METKLGRRRMESRGGVAEERLPLSGLDELFQSHSNWLRQLLERRLRAQPADVEDLIQDTYLRVSRQPAGSIAHPRAFLVTTALNLFRDSRRRLSVRAEHRRSVEQRQESDAGPAGGLAEQEAAVLLAQILAEMPALYRDVFALSRFRHMSYAEIAERLGLSVKTVEWRIGKALEFCVSRLQD